MHLHNTPGFNLISLFSFLFKNLTYNLPGIVKTCGKPNIQNIMNNVTVRPGQSASFKCQVDMSCIVAYIEWYHEMDNGTEKLIKVRVKPFISIYSIIIIENEIILISRSNR